MGARISIVIPTIKRRELLRECLESLRLQTVSDFETILISDGAGEWSRELALEYGCKFLSFPKPRGFAAAINAGVAAAQSEYVVLLNDDVQLDRDWLKLTSSALEQRPELAFCCGKIYRPDGVVLDNAGDAISLAGSAWRLGLGRKDSEEFDSTRQVFACPGTATLVLRAVFDKLGGFDETFFAYLEDMDFSLRAARYGYRGLYLPLAKSIHRGGSTSGGPESKFVIRWMTQNQLLVLAKNYPWSLWLYLLPRIIWAQLLWAAMAVQKKRLGAYLAGVSGFFRLLPGALRSRRPWRHDEISEFFRLLKDSEHEIYNDVRAPDRSERDTFWRLYFALFPPRGPAPTVKPGLGRLPIC